MRFNKLDLNLLVALDALLKERSITRAAERLHLSASAVSNALSRLRDYFGDELLVQVGRRMELTPRAQSLQDPVRDVLTRVESTISIQPVFEPAESDRCFRIFCSDYAQLVLGPHLLALASAQSRSVGFEFLPQVALPHRDLERGEADLLVVPEGLTSPDHPRETLYQEAFVCVVWSGSPLAQGEMTLERYVQARHAVMRPANSTAEPIETQALRRQGLLRQAGVVSYSFAAIPALVTGTDLVATVHARLAARLAAAWPLVIKPMPLRLARLEQCMQWHKYRTQDPGLVWLRSLLLQAVRRMDGVAVASSDSCSPAPGEARGLHTGNP